MKIKMFTIPNMITLLNLLCGCMAVTAAFMGMLDAAFWLIAAAAVFDFLDGFAARLLKQYSEIGKQLDSLADVVSFGVAPSAVMFTMFAGATDGFGAVWGVPVFLLAAFSALRLAKFNIDERQSEEFIGLPTPACALLVGSAGYLSFTRAAEFSPGVLLVASAVLCFLLVCNLRMFSLKFHAWGWRENALRYCFLAASAVALAVLQIAAVPLIIAAYVAVSAVRAAVCRNK